MDINDTYEAVQRAERTYHRLKQCFDEFATQASQHLGPPGQYLRGLEFKVPEDQQYFEVMFAGRKLRFEWFAWFDERATLKGLMRCSTPSLKDPKKVEEVGSLCFDHLGNSDFVFDDQGEDADGEALNIREDGRSSLLVLTFVLRAIRSTA